VHTYKLLRLVTIFLYVINYLVFLCKAPGINTHTIQHETVFYLKADISQLNLPHGTQTKKWKTEKLKTKTDMLSSIGRQSGESVG